MKILFALMMFLLPMSSMPSESESKTIEDNSEVVSVEVEFNDGTIKMFTFSIDDDCALEALNLLSNVVVCNFTDGTCGCIAATCAAARSCYMSRCRPE